MQLSHGGQTSEAWSYLHEFQIAQPLSYWPGLKARRGQGQTKCLYPWHVNESLVTWGWFTLPEGDQQGPTRVAIRVSSQAPPSRTRPS